MLASCALTSYINVIQWTYIDYCTFYNGNPCPQWVVQQYSNVSYPLCPPTCSGGIIPSAYCELYAGLIGTCVNTSADISLLQRQCIKAYAASATTVTDVTIAPVVLIAGTSAEEILSDPDAMMAMRQSLADTGDFNLNDVNISDITTVSRRRHLSLTNSMHLGIQMTTAAEVNYIVKLAAESKGYSSNDVSVMVSSITSNIEQKVTSGSFSQSLQKNIGEKFIPSLANAEVDTVATSTALKSSVANVIVEFKVTGSPSLSPTNAPITPTITPTLLPTINPTTNPTPMQLSGSKKQEEDVVGIAVGVTFGIVALFLMIGVSVYYYIIQKKKDNVQNEELADIRTMSMTV